MQHLKLIECPRDAMQGIKEFIPTKTKVDYINALLKCGFDTIDFGSFVSPKAIPQMQDTAVVLEQLNPSESKLLAIVANERGAEDASKFDRIDYLGYPFSVSEEFQKRNTNSTIDESFSRVERIKQIADSSGKEVVLYLSMGFGNPYGEKWDPELVTFWAEKLFTKLDIRIQAVSDTIGAADPTTVSSLFSAIIPNLPSVEFGAHLHTVPGKAGSLVSAAYMAGCRRFDGALKGFGGCPMAKDDLTGNMPTEEMKNWFDENNIATGLNTNYFDQALVEATKVFA